MALPIKTEGGSPPVVSICIPAYSRPLQLREAIASVLSQTEPRIEVVVTDDSPRRQDLSTEFGDDRLRYYWNPRTLGMAANWQRGISLARGRFIGLLMDDDRLLPTFVERCLAAFALEPGLGVVFANHFSDDGTRVVAREQLIRGGTYREFLLPLLRYKPVAICSTLMRREVWDRVLPVPDLHTADLALYIRAAQAGCAFHYIPDPLMVYRVHDQQLSGDLAFRDHSVALWRLFDFEQGSEEEALRRRLFAEALLSSAAGRMQSGEGRQAAELAQEAATLGIAASELSTRARAIWAISKSRVAMRAAAGAFRLVRWARNTRRGGRRQTL